MLRLVDPARASARGAASLAEIGQTLSTWPQLASDVTLGGASVAATVRRLGTGEPVPSGRVRVDVEALLEAMETPELPDGRRLARVRSRRRRPRTPSAPWSTPPPVPPRAGTPSRGGSSSPATSSPSSSTGRRPRSWTCGGGAATWPLGAALFNARVAAAALGRLGPVELFPEGPASDVVAQLTLVGGRRPGAGRALPRRPRPVRQPPEGRAGSASTLGRGPPGRGDPHRGRRCCTW